MTSIAPGPRAWPGTTRPGCTDRAMKRERGSRQASRSCDQANTRSGRRKRGAAAEPAALPAATATSQTASTSAMESSFPRKSASSSRVSMTWAMSSVSPISTTARMKRSSKRGSACDADAAVTPANPPWTHCGADGIRPGAGCRPPGGAGPAGRWQRSRSSCRTGSERRPNAQLDRLPPPEPRPPRAPCASGRACLNLGHPTSPREQGC